MKNKITAWLCSVMLVLGTLLFSLPVHAEDGRDMYRLYNPNSGEHFYTADGNEKNHLVSVGWRYEGTGWTAPFSGEPVYRLYNPNAGDHHYTTSQAEKNHLLRAGWRDEGIGWYSDTSRRVALYRVYNRNARTGTHHYTTSKGEANSLVKAGWKDEGIGWFGIAAGKPETPPSKPSNPSQPSKPSTPPEQIVRFIVNKQTKKFHHDWCPSIHNMKESNKVPMNKTKSQMILLGYDPCHVCIR